MRRKLTLRFFKSHFVPVPKSHLALIIPDARILKGGRGFSSRRPGLTHGAVVSLQHHKISNLSRVVETERKMVAKQRIRMANEKHSKNITQRGNVAKTLVSR